MSYTITVTPVDSRAELEAPMRSTKFFVKSGHAIVYSVPEGVEIQHPLPFPEMRISFTVGIGTYEATFNHDSRIAEEAPVSGMVAPAVACRETHWYEPRLIDGIGPPTVAGIHLFVTRFCNGTIQITIQLSNGTVNNDGTGFCGELAVRDLRVWLGTQKVLETFEAPTYLGARGILVERVWLYDDEDPNVEFARPKRLKNYGPANVELMGEHGLGVKEPVLSDPLYYGEPNGAAPGGADLYPINVSPPDHEVAQRAIARQRLACYARKSGTRLAFSTELRLTRGVVPTKITEIPCFVRSLSPYDDAREYIEYNGKAAYRYDVLRGYSPFDGQHLIRAFTWLEPLIMWEGDAWAIHTMKSLAAEARTSWNPERKPASYGWRPFSLGNLLEDSPRNEGSANAGREFGWVCHLASWALSLTRRQDRAEHGVWMDWCGKLLAFASQVMPPSGIPLRVEKVWASGGQTSFWTDFGVPDNEGVAQALELPIVWWGIHCIQAQLGISPLDWAIVEGCRSVYTEIKQEPDPWGGTAYGPPKCITVSRDMESLPKAKNGHGPGEPINGFWILPVAHAICLATPRLRPQARFFSRALRDYGHKAPNLKAKEGALFYSGDLNTYYLAWLTLYNLSTTR